MKFPINTLVFFAFFGIETKFVQAGTTMPNWPVGTPNACRSASDAFINFERGVDRVQIESANPGFAFTNTGGLDWIFGDIRTGAYNVNQYQFADASGAYGTNENFFAWLGEDGDRGRIDFAGESATYFSMLASASSSGLQLEAYDADGNMVDSVSIDDNLFDFNNGEPAVMTQMTVESIGGISYVEIFDSGNFWTIDDICTDATSPCTLMPGRPKNPSSRSWDIVILKDNNFVGSDADFLTFLNNTIENNLFGLAPVTGNENRFNFYLSSTITGDVNSSDYNDALGNFQDTQRCGPSTIPDDFFDQCPFADNVVVVTTDAFRNCAWQRVLSTPFNAGGVLLHEWGHGLFGLSDEYDDSTNNPPCSTGYSNGVNIWSSLAGCNAAIALNAPFSGFTCRQFTTCNPGFWNINDGQANVMDAAIVTNGWSPSSVWGITTALNNIASGPPTSPAGAPFLASDKSISVKLNIDADAGLSFVAAGLRLAPSQNYVCNDGYIVIEIYDDTDTLLSSFCIEDPLGIDNAGLRGVSTDAYPFGQRRLQSLEAENIIIPYFTTASYATFSDGVGPDVTVDLSSFAGEPTEPGAPPTAECQDVSVANDPGLCSATGVTIDDNSSDPEGLAISLYQNPPAPYPVGTTSVTLEVTNSDEQTATCSATVTVSDTEDPKITSFPGDVTVECNAVPPPATSQVSGTDNCGSVSVVYNGQTPVAGSCASNYALLRTWTVSDTAGNAVSQMQTVTVQDTTAPDISCDGFVDISPNDVSVNSPMSFTPTATDVCSEVGVTVTAYECYRFNKQGKKIAVQCNIELDADTATVFISGGVGTIIEWTVEAVDACGNSSSETCYTNVVNPGI